MKRDILGVGPMGSKPPPEEARLILHGTMAEANILGDVFHSELMFERR